MTFVEYKQPRKVPKKQQPFCSITANSQIMFSVAACRDFDLDIYEYCRLSYDQENQLIGIEFLTDPVPYSFTVSRWPGSLRGVLISAVRFFKKFDVNIEHITHKRYEISKDSNGLIVIDLKKVISDLRGKKPKYAESKGGANRG